MYEQSKSDYAKYEPNTGYPPSAYAPLQAGYYQGYRPRRNRLILTFLLLTALIVVGLSAALVSGVGRHLGFDTNSAIVEADPGGDMAAPPLLQAVPARPDLFKGSDALPKGKPIQPTTKGCNSNDTSCIESQQSLSEAVALPSGKDCSPCLWTASPDYQPVGDNGSVQGAYHIYDMESLNPGVDAAIKQDLASGWSLHVEVGPHDRALVFSDIGMVCEASDQCHAIGKLWRSLNKRAPVRMNSSHGSALYYIQRIELSRL